MKISREKKLMYSSFLALATMLIVAFLRQNIWVNIILLSVVAFLLIKVDGSKHDVKLFFAGFILGPLAEAICIHFGAWRYSETFILGFPIYLPFVWGNAALYFKRIAYSADYL